MDGGYQQYQLRQKKAKEQAQLLKKQKEEKRVKTLSDYTAEAKTKPYPQIRGSKLRQSSALAPISEPAEWLEQSSSNRDGGAGGGIIGGAIGEEDDEFESLWAEVGMSGGSGSSGTEDASATTTSLTSKNNTGSSSSAGLSTRGLLAGGTASAASTPSSSSSAQQGSYLAEYEKRRKLSGGIASTTSGGATPSSSSSAGNNGLKLSSSYGVVGRSKNGSSGGISGAASSSTSSTPASSTSTTATKTKPKFTPEPRQAAQIPEAGTTASSTSVGAPPYYSARSEDHEADEKKNATIEHAMRLLGADAEDSASSSSSSSAAASPVEDKSHDDSAENKSSSSLQSQKIIASQPNTFVDVKPTKLIKNHSGESIDDSLDETTGKAVLGPKIHLVASDEDDLSDASPTTGTTGLGGGDNLNFNTTSESNFLKTLHILEEDVKPGSSSSFPAADGLPTDKKVEVKVDTLFEDVESGKSMQKRSTDTETTSPPPGPGMKQAARNSPTVVGAVHPSGTTFERFDVSDEESSSDEEDDGTSAPGIIGEEHSEEGDSVLPHVKVDLDTSSVKEENENENSFEGAASGSRQGKVKDKQVVDAPAGGDGDSDTSEEDGGNEDDSDGEIERFDVVQPGDDHQDEQGHRAGTTTLHQHEIISARSPGQSQTFDAANATSAAQSPLQDGPVTAEDDDVIWPSHEEKSSVDGSATSPTKDLLIPLPRTKSEQQQESNAKSASASSGPRSRTGTLVNGKQNDNHSGDQMQLSPTLSGERTPVEMLHEVLEFRERNLPKERADKNSSPAGSSGGNVKHSPTSPVVSPATKVIVEDLARETAESILSKSTRGIGEGAPQEGSYDAEAPVFLQDLQTNEQNDVSIVIPFSPMEEQDGVLVKVENEYNITSSSPARPGDKSHKAAVEKERPDEEKDLVLQPFKQERKQGNLNSVLAAFQAGIDQIETGKTTDDGPDSRVDDGRASSNRRENNEMKGQAASGSASSGAREQDDVDHAHGGETSPLPAGTRTDKNANFLAEFDIDDDLEAIYASNARNNNPLQHLNTFTNQKQETNLGKKNSSSSRNKNADGLSMQGMLAGSNTATQSNVPDGSTSSTTGTTTAKQEFIMSSKPAGKSKFVARQDPFEAALRQKMQNKEKVSGTSSKNAQLNLNNSSVGLKTGETPPEDPQGGGTRKDSTELFQDADSDLGLTSPASSAKKSPTGKNEDERGERVVEQASSSSSSKIKNDRNKKSSAQAGYSAPNVSEQVSSVLSQYRRPDLKESLEKLEREIKESRGLGKNAKRSEGEAQQGKLLEEGSGKDDDDFRFPDHAGPDSIPDEPTDQAEIDRLEKQERAMWDELEKKPKVAKKGAIQPKTQESLLSYREFVQDYLMSLGDQPGAPSSSGAFSTAQSRSTGSSSKSSSSSALCCLLPSSAAITDPEMLREKQIINKLAFHTNYEPSGNETHLRALGTLYKKLTTSPTSPLPVDSRWEVLGFQNTDPKTDLNRFGKMCNVWHLLHFYYKDGALLEKMWLLSQDSVQEFPLFCTSIQFSKLVLEIFYTPTEINPEHGGVIEDQYKSARGKLVRFLNSANLGVIDGLAFVQNALLFAFYDRWQSEVLTITAFGKVYKDIETVCRTKNLISTGYLWIYHAVLCYEKRLCHANIQKQGFVNRYNEYKEHLRKANDPSRLEFTDLGGSRAQPAATKMSRAEQKRLNQYANQD
ncbi:unnamed protein product [Amoebophrya sp. A120]|nr:unnamed protein product [Amoebophrya sp. A120]|eukprot:GSA120T00014132001.1